MDINCVYECRHQKDGKCYLSEIPDLFVYSVNDIDKEDDTGCLYFEKKF